MRGQRQGWRGSSLERFLRSCEFDPATGCVLWTGGKSSGRGHNIKYGVFWDEGRRHFAHRWSGRRIHGHEIDGLQVDHCCPPYRAGPVWMPPNTLCVQHVQPVTLLANRELQTLRVRESQTVEQRRYWVHVAVGLEDCPESVSEMSDALPYYEPPVWMRAT